MSLKRVTCNADGATEGRNPVDEQDQAAKRAKLASLGDTTLQDLPIELIECILVKVVVMEVKGMKLAKRVWKEKADMVISRLKAVCSRWREILSSGFVIYNIHQSLDLTAQETIRLEILHQSTMTCEIHRIATTVDKIFLLCRKDNLVVYGRENFAEVKEVIPPQGMCIVDVAACNVSNCVYALGVRLGCFEILRIVNNEEHQCNIVSWFNDLSPSLFFPSISVSTTGSLIMRSMPEGQTSAGFTIYEPNGKLLQAKITLSPAIAGFRYWDNVIQKSNGNLVSVSVNDQADTVVTEIDTTGRIKRQYKSASGIVSGVHFADNQSGRIVFTESGNRIQLVDSEFNPLFINGPPVSASQLHYNSARNEILAILSLGNNQNVITIFRFTEE